MMMQYIILPQCPKFVNTHLCYIFLFNIPHPAHRKKRRKRIARRRFHHRFFYVLLFCLCSLSSAHGSLSLLPLKLAKLYESSLSRTIKEISA